MKNISFLTLIIIILFATNSFALRSFRMEYTYDPSIDNPTEIWMPLHREWDGNGMKNVKILEISPKPTDRYFDPNGTGTEIAYWKASGDWKDKIKIRFELDLELIEHNIDDNREWPQYDKSSNLYVMNTSPTVWVQSDHPDIKAQAKLIVGNEKNPYKQARLIHAWVWTEIIGSPPGPPHEPDGDALLVLQRGTAGCGGYANIFVALCRSIGIPARSVGSWPPGDPGKVYFMEGSHC